MNIPKLQWRLPQKCDVVVFDRFATQGILPVLCQTRHTVFENRQSHLNLWALLRMIVCFHFSWLDYCVAYLQCTRANVVITGVDSNPVFYRLKHRLPGVVFIAVQNGIRGSGSPRQSGDLWSALRSPNSPHPSVDIVATFGTAHSRQFREHIDCQTIEIGSSRSNAIPLSRKSGPQLRRQIALISNFSGLPHIGLFPDGNVAETAMFLGTRQVSAREYFAADAQVAAILARICQRQGWDFNIVGRRNESFPSERRFFEFACEGLPFTFIAKSFEESSYLTLDHADLVVSIDSTLGYEMISRGQRVLFIQARAELLGGPESKQFSFGFPGSYPKEGPFWTSKLDLSEISSRLNSMLGLTFDQWREASCFATSELMVSDPNNGKLSALLDSLLTPRKRQSDSVRQESGTNL
jgi:surface carbohydrate biosynthesis protein